MDSPEPNKTISSAAAAISASAAASSDSPVQESPFSNFLSNLSPINPVKAEHVPQGFLGINSPPLVFTSPRTTLHHRTSFLQRSQLSHISSLETPEKDDVRKNLDGSREPETYCRKLIHDIQEDNDVKNNTQDQFDSLSGCPDEYLNNSEECINSVNLLDQNVKQSNDVLESSISGLSIATSHDKSHTSTEFETSVLFEPVKGTPLEQSFNENKPVYHEEDHLSTDDGPVINQCDVFRNQENEEDVENMKTTLQGSIQNIEKCDLEVSQLQRGLSRRCLQFEEAGRKNVARSVPSSNKRDTTIDLGSLALTKNTESLGSPHVDSTASSNKTKMLNLTQLAISAFVPPSASKSHTVVPKPSGIGLHLNSIALPKGSNSSVVITPAMNSNHVENKDYSERLSKLVQKVVLAPRDDKSEPLSSLTISSSNSELCQPVKPLNTMLPPKDYVTPSNKRNFDLEHADNFEELSQLSPTNKKRKTSLSADGDGCKRCNCKKTKCLKLYCDCFAAGIYCGDGCACQGCFNKPEHEDTVMEARQLIESRNPLAFAPKVVQPVAERTLIKEDGSRIVPSLARHKRGCNCKKSMCLKKYCECYQANVGCSTECRCEGCRNSYGKKEEYCASEEILHNRVFKERYGGKDDNNTGILSNKGLLQAELQDPHSLTPSTPPFHQSDHGKDVAISDFSNLSSYTRHIRSPRNSLSNDVIQEGKKETPDMDSLGQEMDYSVVEMMDQFSPGRNSLAGIYDLTPSHDSSTTAQAPSASSKTKGSISSSRFQLSSHSLRWRSSPITPMPELGEIKGEGNDSESGNCENPGDETPEILKESLTSVKATSPNKKRVSPPQHHVHGLRASSSVGLRSGRKFTLTAISSSSTLAPCNQSNDQTDDKSSNN